MATAVSDDDQPIRRTESPLSERSQPSVDEDDLTGPNPTRDALADGIVSLLSPTLKTLDQGVLATKRSQEELSEQIALLTDQLKVISAEQVCPIDLDGYVNRLGTIKGKINVISSVLHAAQERLNKVHDQAVKEASRRKPLIEASPVVSSSVSASGTSASTSTAGSGVLSQYHSNILSQGQQSQAHSVGIERGEDAGEGISQNNQNDQEDNQNQNSSALP